MQKFEGFDDCEICRAMQAAEKLDRPLSESELMEAFKRQKQSGVGLVGFGEDFDQV